MFQRRHNVLQAVHPDSTLHLLSGRLPEQEHAPQCRDIPYVETATNKGMGSSRPTSTPTTSPAPGSWRRLALLYHHEASPAHERLREGDELELGNAHIQIIHTAHTPESVSLLVQDRSRAPEPHFVIPFSWAAPAGRISSGRRANLAEQLYESIFSKLLRLEDHIEIYPAHFRVRPWGSAPNPCPPSASRRGSTRSCLPATGRSLCDWSRTCPPRQLGIHGEA